MPSIRVISASRRCRYGLHGIAQLALALLPLLASTKDYHLLLVLSAPALVCGCRAAQGIYLDTDGTLLNSNTLAPSLLPAGIPTGAGATWHSAVDNQLFNSSDCVYVSTTGASNGGAWCSPALTFRRMMVRRLTLFSWPVDSPAQQIRMVRLAVYRYYQ